MIVNSRFLLLTFFTTLFIFAASFVAAQPKHDLFVPGLQAPVEVLRDHWGINHIYAGNQHDLFLLKVIVPLKTACSNLKYGAGRLPAPLLKYLVRRN